MRQRRLLLATALMLLGSNAHAKDIAVCGASAGYGYYPRIGVAANYPDAGRWTEDTISSGRMTLTALQDGKLDLLIADASGSVFSSRQDGAEVIALAHTGNTIAVAVAYSGSIESYTFLRSETGLEVIWTTNKFDSIIIKAAAYRAECSMIDFK